MKGHQHLEGARCGYPGPISRTAYIVAALCTVGWIICWARAPWLTGGDSGRLVGTGAALLLGAVVALITARLTDRRNT